MFINLSRHEGIHVFLWIGTVIFFLIIVTIASYGSSRENYVIRFSKGVISGPSNSGYKKVEIPINAVDMKQTISRSFWNRINGDTIICAKDGAKIRLSHAAFGKTERAQILKLIANLQSNAETIV